MALIMNVFPSECVDDGIDKTEVVYLPLRGGDKSTQKRDIKTAKAILSEIDRGERT